MRIFTFGSNTAGIHGKGSAREALVNHGAEWGRGEGLQGWSYAIATKDSNLRSLPREIVRQNVETFLAFAREHPEHEFDIVAVGTGLAGFTPEAIAPMFAGAPDNCHLPPEFLEVLK